MMNAATLPRGLVGIRANDDIAGAIACVASAFDEFKADQRKRFDDVVLRMDEVEKRQQRPNLGGGGGAARSETNAQAVAEFFAAARRRDVGLDEFAASDLDQYSAAFRDYLRVGRESLPADVQAAMQIGSDPDGGYWAAPPAMGPMKTRLFDTSPMRQLTQPITLMGADSIKFPTDTNEAVSGGWVGETETRSETATPLVGEQVIYLREQYAEPRVTQKLLDMSGFPVEAWLGDKIGRKLGRDENTAFVVGSGVNQPRGFLNYKTAAVTTGDSSRAWGVLQYVPSGASGGFPDASGIAGAKDPDALIDLQHALKAEYRANAVWVMNRATAGVVRKLKDGDGRYLWTDPLTAGQPPLLLGSPVVAMEDMENVGADSFSIAYGDFGVGYQIVDGPGIRILRDPFTSKGWVKFYATKWTGGDVVDFDAIKLMKFATS